MKRVHSPEPHDPERPEFDDDHPSKSQRKREMHALQDIGSQLVELSRERLKKMPMPEELLTAVLDYQRFTKHEARRRQLQYIGKLMRNIDPAPIQAQLDIFNGNSAAETARLHRLERLREQLLEDEKALQSIMELWPACDLQHLRNLRRNAIKEREQQKPPRAFREIFQVLRELDEGAARGAPAESDPQQDAGE